MMRRKQLVNVARRTALLYALFAAAWAVLSDDLLIGSGYLHSWGSLHSWLFVVITTSLLYAQMRIPLQRWENESRRRREAEESLRESEERFRKAIEFLPTPISIAERDGTILFYNQAFTERFGYRLSDAATIQDWALLAYPDFEARETALAQWRNDLIDFVQKGSTSPPRLYTVACKDGSLRSAEIMARFAGNLLVTTFVDMTERKSMEAAVRREAEHRAVLLDLSRLVLESAVERKDLTETIFEKVRSHLSADLCLNYRFEERDATLHLVCGIGVPEALAGTVRILGLGETFCGTVAETRQPLAASRDRIANDPLGALVASMGANAYACRPLLKRDGRLQGTLSFASCTRTSFDEDELDFMETVAHLLSVAWERMDAESELRQREGILKLFVEHAPAALAMLDREMRYITASNRWLHSFQLNGRDLRGAYHHEVFPEMPESWKEAHLRGLAGETIRVDADPVRSVDGSDQWLRGEVRPWFQTDGDVGGILIFAEDITESIRSHDQIRQLSRAVEQSPSLIVITDSQGHIEYVNPRITEVTGYTLEELRGKTPRVFKSTTATAQEYERLWRIITSGGEWRGELQNRKKNGELFWVSVVIAPIVNEEGRITHFLATEEDITGRKSLEEQLRQIQKMEAIGQLAGGVAHDFNNLLTVIQGHCALLASNLEMPLGALESVKDIEQASERATNLTRQLLTFGRRQIMQRSDLDLTVCVSNVVKMLERILGEDVSVEVHYAPGPLRVNADAGMLDQILLNLAVNSRDSMPNGGRLTIGVAKVDLDFASAALVPQARPGSFACISVADTGCGIRAEDMAHIFEPFFTTKPVGKGTGLGLATVYGIVQQHCGWMGVESKVGEGTSFRVYLPLLAEKPSEKPDRKETTSIRGGEETILVVEDETTLRALVRTILSRHGYQVLEAASGAAALEVWAKQRSQIDLVLTDLVMPDGITGVELASRILKDEPRLPIIFTSGYGPAQSEAGIKLEDGVNFLPKPYAPRKLAQAVRSRLDQGSKRR